MATNRQTHQIGKIKKLIDLNGDTINFDITFRVATRNKEPFDLLVVDQTTLDNNPNLEYKRVDNGSISGNIVQDKNIYQNYFLILKAENPCECDVEIVKKELPKTPMQAPQPVQAPVPSPLKNKKSADGFNWAKILLIVGVISAVGIGLYLFSKKSDPAKNSENPVPSDAGAGFRFYSPPKSSASPIHATPKPAKGNALLERLKRLNVN